MILRITSTIPVRDTSTVNGSILGGFVIGDVVETTDMVEQNNPPSQFAYVSAVQGWIALHIDHYTYTEEA